MDRELAKIRKARLDKIIGQNIRRERDRNKMSREDLAEALDLTVSHMGLIERGERGATAVTLENLKHVFRVPIDTFFDVPDRKLYAVKERDYRNATRKKKVLTAIDMLDDHELKFLSHVIKGFVKLRLLLSS